MSLLHVCICLIVIGVSLLALVIGGTIWFRRRRRRRGLEQNGKYISPGDNQQQLLPGYQLGQQHGDGQQGMAHGSGVGESTRRSTDENEWCADCLACVAVLVLRHFLIQHSSRMLPAMG